MAWSSLSQCMQEINERVRLANDQNRTAVIIMPAKNVISIGFVLRFGKNNQGATLHACVMGNFDPPWSLEERMLQELKLRLALSTLLFFEGLRAMAATSYGVCCPVRSIDWAERFTARLTGD